MPFTFAKKVTVSSSGAGSISARGNSYIADQSATVNQTVPAGSTNLEIDIAFPTTGLAIVELVSSVDMTVKTNSSGSPQETLALKAGVGVGWAKDDLHACPFAGAVTKFFVTNSGTKDGKVECLAGFGATT